MGAKSAFTTGNYQCKPQMTDVILIDKVKKDRTSAKVYDPSSLCPISGTSCVHKQRDPLNAYKYSCKSYERGKASGCQQCFYCGELPL